MLIKFTTTASNRCEVEQSQPAHIDRRLVAQNTGTCSYTFFKYYLLQNMSLLGRDHVPKMYLSEGKRKATIAKK